jgi:hypothetical protein
VIGKISMFVKGAYGREQKIAAKSDVAILAFVSVKWLHYIISRDVLFELFPKAVPATFLAPNQFGRSGCSASPPL